MGFAPTVSIYNVFDLSNCYEWFKKMTRLYPGHFLDFENYTFDNVVTSPIYLSTSIMPKKLKVQASEKIKDIKNLRNIYDSLLLDNNGYEKAFWGTFINFTKDLDKLRGQNVVNYIPELKEYF